MRNKVQNGKTIAYTVPSGVTIASGDLVVLDSMVGVAITGGTEGQSIELELEGVFNIPKTTGVAFTLGAKLYWVSGTKKLTNTDNSGANAYVGAAFLAAGSAATVAELKLAQP